MLKNLAATRADRHARRAQQPATTLMADVAASTATHYPDRTHLTCGCGSIAFVAYHDRATGTAALFCLVCGTIPANAFRF